jgi:GxxExxY protein
MNKLSSDVINAAINVHKILGPGLLESVYQSCMKIELSEMGMNVKAEVPVPIKYSGRDVTEQGLKFY